VLVSSKKITAYLYRYTFLPDLCIALAPVHIFTIFTTANQKASSKTVVHKICTGTHFYQTCVYRLHRYSILSFLPRPIRKRPQRRSCTRFVPVHIFTRPVQSACTGTPFYHSDHGQSESVLKDGRVVRTRV